MKTILSLSFTLTYKFTGNEPISNFVSVPILYSDYCALTAEAAVFEQLYDGSWGKLGTSMTNSYQNNFGIGDINFSLRSFDPDGENNEIAVRCFIIVPNDVAEDDDPLMLYLNGFDGGAVKNWVGENIRMNWKWPGCANET